MDGFYEGVQYYNKQKGKNVQVLGWNEADQKGGTFAGSFTDQNKGLQISQTFIQQGADVIFPVAGGAGLGAGAAAQAGGRQGQPDLGRHRRLRLCFPVLPVLHLQRHEEPVRRRADVRDGGRGRHLPHRQLRR